MKIKSLRRVNNPSREKSIRKKYEKNHLMMRKKLQQVNLLDTRKSLIAIIQHTIIYSESNQNITGKMRIAKFIKKYSLPRKYFSMLIDLTVEASKNEYKKFDQNFLNTRIPDNFLIVFQNLAQNPIFMETLELYMLAKEEKQSLHKRVKKSNGFHLIYSGREKQ